MKPETESLPLLSSCPPPPPLQTLAKCWGGTGIAASLLLPGGRSAFGRKNGIMSPLPAFPGHRGGEGQRYPKSPKWRRCYLSSSWPELREQLIWVSQGTHSVIVGCLWPVAGTVTSTEQATGVSRVGGALGLGMCPPSLTKSCISFLEVPSMLLWVA